MLLALAVPLGVMIWRSGELFRASQFNPPEKSIAVLPFLDLSQAKDQEYFCDGMSEEILRRTGESRGAARRCPHLVIFIQREERGRERGWEKAKRCRMCLKEVCDARVTAFVLPPS